MLDLNVMKHGRTTNLKAGILNNEDAILVLLGSGLTTRQELMAGLKAWRPELRWMYPFNQYNANRLEGSRCEGRGLEATYRRTGKGTYGLTEAGRNRLDNLQA